MFKFNACNNDYQMSLTARFDKRKVTTNIDKKENTQTPFVWAIFIKKKLVEICVVQVSWHWDTGAWWNIYHLRWWYMHFIACNLMFSFIDSSMQYILWYCIDFPGTAEILIFTDSRAQKYPGWTIVTEWWSSFLNEQGCNSKITLIAHVLRRMVF